MKVKSQKDANTIIAMALLAEHLIQVDGEDRLNKILLDSGYLDSGIFHIESVEFVALDKIVVHHHYHDSVEGTDNDDGKVFITRDESKETRFKAEF